MQAPVETPEKRASVTSATSPAERQELERRRQLVGLLHPGAERAAAGEDDHVARLDRLAARALDRGDRVPLAREDARAARRAGRRRRRRATRGSIAVLLITLPPGARLPSGKQTVEVMPFARARSGGQMTSSGSTPSASSEPRAQPGPPLAALPLVEHVVPGPAGDRHARRRGAARARAGAASPRARRRRGTRAPSDGCRGPFGSASTRRGTARLTRRQSSTVGRRRPAAWAIAGMWMQQVRRAAERGVDEHRVLDRLVGEHVVERAPVLPLAVHGARPSGGRRRARSAGPRARAPRAARSARAPRRRPARSPPCRGTGSRRRAWRRRGSRGRPPPRA